MPLLVTTPEDLFGEYAHFSSYSDSWVEHARRQVDDVVDRFGFHSSGKDVEIASSDGYLVRHFNERGVPVLGIEPARSVAVVAQHAGIPTLVEFFGLETAERLRTEGETADLVISNNVLAHIPELGDFVLLADRGPAALRRDRFDALRRRGAADPWRLLAAGARSRSSPVRCLPDSEPPNTVESRIPRLSSAGAAHPSARVDAKDAVQGVRLQLQRTRARRKLRPRTWLRRFGRTEECLGAAEGRVCSRCRSRRREWKPCTSYRTNVTRGDSSTRWRSMAILCAESAVHSST
jgi:hypothetical protein